MDSSALQQQLFRQIKSLLPGNISFADAIADLLGISADSAYRRIRGEKQISFEEIQKLSRHYHISLDTLLQIDSTAKVFYGTWLGQENYGFEQYLQNMLALLQSISKGDQKMIYYEAKDFPPFYYFHFPELAAFKNYFWMRVILSYPEYNKLHYEDCRLEGASAKTGQEIIKAFNRVPSIEIWSMETINSTLNQIQYCREVGAFRKEESITILYDQLVSLLEHVRDQAECGEKLALGQKPYGGPPFRLYYNEAYLGHNTIMTEVDGLETVYVNHGVLNLMYTHDKDFCANTRWYFENTMKKSAPISNVNDKERSKFFNHMLDKVAHAKATARLSNDNAVT
jgi:hypothetical protein